MAEYKECPHYFYDLVCQSGAWTRYSKGPSEKYAEVHDAEEAWVPTGQSEWSSTVGCSQSYWGEYYYGKWRISRGQMIYDTSDIGSEFEIEAACIVYHPLGTCIMPYFKPKGGYPEYSGDFNFVVVSGENLAIPKVKANYGALHDATESLGECPGSEFWQRGCIELNPAGIAAINKGGLTKFGLRNSRDISAHDPNEGEEDNEDTYHDGGGTIGIYMGFTEWRSKLILNYKTGTTPGQIWVHEVDGKRNASGYIDQFGHRRLWIGKQTGYQHADRSCLEIGGANFYYSDGDRRIRRIWPQPEMEGATGKVPGQFSAVGKKFSYIDNSGNERRFQGVPGVLRFEWEGYTP